MIAHLQQTASRGVVEQANEMLVRMAHRGAVGCDPCSGDGAGMLVALPHAFCTRVLQEVHPSAQLTPGNYALGQIFFGKDPASIQASKAIFDDAANRMGYTVLGWRVVPTNNAELGDTSKQSEPHVEQVFVQNKGLDSDTFEKDMLLLRTLATTEAEAKDHDFYVCSLSNRTVTYKGQLTPEQLYTYYPDLSAKDFLSYVALVHSRFSTNTFPSVGYSCPCD